MLEVNWVFAAKLDRVVDGDTVHLVVDLGMHCYRTESFRLARCNAPELSTSEGKLAKQYTIDWFNIIDSKAAYPLVIQTHKTDNWGRYIVEVWRPDNHNLTDDLIASGNAKVWT